MNLRILIKHWIQIIPKIKMKLLLFIILFFMIISLIIINNNELRISEKEDFHIFLGTYADWLKVFYFNIKSITGNIVSQNWFPG